MRGGLSCPKVGGGTAVVLGEGNVIVNQIVSIARGGSSIIPINSHDDDVCLGVGLNGGLEGLSGARIRVVAALSARSLLANLVLIHVNQRLVLENCFGSEAHVSHVRGEEKR